MPAPERIGDRRLETRVLDVPKMIIGHYTDLEVDALLEGYATKEDVAGLGGGAGDLSAYATTEYVDAAVAGVSTTPPDLSDYYTKPEVDQKFVDAASGGTVELSGYATTQYVDDTKAEILTVATTAFQERYTKQEVDGLFVKQADLVAPPNLDGYATEQYVDDTIARIPATDLSAYYTKPQTDAAIKAAAEQSALDLDAVQTQLVYVIEETGRQTQAKIDLKADKAALSDYAKLTDDAQVVTAQRFAGRGLVLDQFIGGSSKGSVGLGDLNNGNGIRLGVSIDGKEPSQLAWVKDLAAYCTIMDAATRIADCAKKADTYTKAEVDAKIPAVGGSVDLSAYAKLDDAAQAIVCKTVTADRFFLQPDKSIVLLESGGSERPVYRAGAKNFALAFTTELQGLAKVTDLDQVLTTKSVIAQGFAFDQQNVIKIHDTGEGYGPRLTFITAAGNDVQVEPIVLKSDLEPLAALLPRLETVEAMQGISAGKVNINDPALEEFKRSILAEVAKKMSGDDRFQPPEDILKTGTDRSGFFIQMINGWIELIGTVTIPKGSSNMTLGTYPDKFPLPDRDASYPVACRETAVAVRYGYISVNAANRSISFSPGGPVNEVTVSGVRFKAKWS